MTEHTLTIDSISYHILLSGPQDQHAPTILLTHALMSNLHMWDSTVASLNQANYRTIRFDHIGHDRTPPPPEATHSYTTDDITRHMHAIASHLSPGGLKAVIGCSIGGVLALRYAMLYPSQVEIAISLCAPGIKSPEHTEDLWTQRIAQFEADLASGDDSLCHATVQRWLPGDGAGDEAARREALGHVRTCSLKGYRLLADAIRGFDYSEQLEREGLGDVKCVIVAGGRDTASSVEALEEVAATIRKSASPQAAEFVLMQDAGHIPPMHCPKEFEEVLLAALR